MSPQLIAKKNVCDQDFESYEAYRDILVFNKETGIEARILSLNSSEDALLLEQYYLMRHNSYRGEYGFEDYVGSRSKDDERGFIIAVYDANRKVLGGSRVMVRKFDSDELLSNEFEGTQYTFGNVFKIVYNKDLPKPYGEISAVVVVEGYRDTKIMAMMLDISAEFFKRNNVSFAFGVAPKIHCINYKIISSRIGYKTQILKDFLWKKNEIYNSIDMFPVIVSDK